MHRVKLSLLEFYDFFYVGSQRSSVICVEQQAGRVEDRYCDVTTKEEDKVMECNMHICPAR